MPLSSAKFALKIHANQVAKQECDAVPGRAHSYHGERGTHGL